MKKILLFLAILISSLNLFADGGWVGDKVRASTNNIWVGSITPPTVYAGDWFEGEIWLWYQNDPGLGAQFRYTTDNWSTIQYDQFARGTVSGINARYSNEGSAIGPWLPGTQVKYQIQCWHAWIDPDFYTTEASFTVQALNNPTNQSATRNVSNPQTQIDLTWNANAQGHFVMIVRKKSTDSWTEPTQGTSYPVGSDIGAGKVVYWGNGSSFTDTELAPF